MRPTPSIESYLQDFDVMEYGLIVIVSVLSKMRSSIILHNNKILTNNIYSAVNDNNKIRTRGYFIPFHTIIVPSSKRTVSYYVFGIKTSPGQLDNKKFDGRGTVAFNCCYLYL